MTKKIRSAAKLPKWFDAKKYLHLKSASSAEWAVIVEYLLDIRADIDAGANIGSLMRESIKKAHASDPEWADVLAATDNQLIDLFFASRLIDPVSDDLVEELGPSRVLRALKDRALAYVGVQSINRIHRHAIATIAAKERDEPLCAPDKPFYIDVLGTINAPFGKHHQRLAGVIAVDMWLPDAILIASFKRWLADARAATSQTKSKKTYGPRDFATWIDDSYVPYWLLRMWADCRGVTISQPALLEALFPTRRSVTVDQFRKTKIPNYENWLSWKTYDTLIAEAEQELFSAEDSQV